MNGQKSPLQDSDVFGQLYNRTHLIVFRFIYGLCGGPSQDVDDLTAETYLRAWKARCRFNGNDQAALGWLFTIARHLVIDAHRRGKVRKEEPHLDSDNISIDSWQALQASNSHGNDPEELSISFDQFRILWALVQALPIEKRELLILRYMLGWQVKQIADHLNMQENTVSVYLRRILEELRNQWPKG
jgi:RNA polymerase sigma-70 factor (ECF subfamily)